MARVCVTGGTGFIGSALVRELTARGREVTVFDSNYRGTSENIGAVRELVRFVEGDVRSIDDVREAVQGCSEVFHLAFINGTENFYRHPGLVLDVGIRGHFNVMDACAEAGVETFVHASSSEVYQTPDRIPTPEDVAGSVPDVRNPRYSYGGGKLACELLTLHYRQEHPMRRVIFRPHNIYGPAMGFEHVIPQLVRKIHAACGKGRENRVEIEIQGDGSQSRAFCHIADAVEGILLVAEKGVDKEIYNLGVDKETTIRELLSAIGRHLGISIAVLPGRLPAGGTLRRCPAIDKVRGMGFEPRIPLQQGLVDTVDWYWNHFETREP